jgi:DNA-binding IclR family transcriptional regulator
MNRFEAVRELVKDPSLRVTDIAKQTGYNKGHVSRLRKEATKKEWVSLTDEEVWEAIDDVLEGGGWLDVARALEAAIKRKNT